MTKPSQTWRERLESVLDKWDDGIVGKSGESNEPTDQELRRIHLGTLLERCGRTKRSDEFDRAVRDGLARRRLFMHPELTGPLPSDCLLKVSRTPIPEPDLHFTAEQHMQEFIEAQYSRLDLFDGLELVDRQHRLPSDRRIDLLFFDQHKNQYVVVELKHQGGGDGATFQLITYMDQLREQRADREKRSIRGLLLMGSVTQSEQEHFAALTKSYDAQLVTYKLRFETNVIAPKPDRVAGEPVADDDSLHYFD